MLKIGITGGMGSGKTTVCRVLETLGVPVYYADDRAKALMNDNEAVKQQVKAFFGDATYGTDGKLIRAELAKQVFNNPEKLKQLESIVHPAVADDFRFWAKQKHFSGVPYMVKEAALLFESGSYKELDKTILVQSPLELRIKRIMQRDNSTREQVLARIEKQWPEDKKAALADYFIQNNEEQLVVPQILELHKHFLHMADMQS